MIGFLANHCHNKTITKNFSKEDTTMKKVSKLGSSKKGFSLVEMVLVLAIICILASSVIYGGLKILKTIESVFGETTLGICDDKK